MEGDRDIRLMEELNGPLAAGPVVSAVYAFKGSVVDGLYAEFDPDFDVSIEFDEKVEGLWGDAVGAGTDAYGCEGKLIEQMEVRGC